MPLPQDTDAKQPAKTKLLSLSGSGEPIAAAAGIDRRSSRLNHWRIHRSGFIHCFYLDFYALCKLCGYYMHRPNIL